MPYKDKEKDKARRREKRDHINAVRRTWGANNRDRLAAEQREWKAANKAKVSEYNRRYRERNPEKSKEHKRKDYVKHREQYRKTSKEWRERIVEQRRIDQAAWYEKNRAITLAKQKKKYDADPAMRQRIVESTKRRRQADPYKRRIEDQRYRAAREATPELTMKQWREVLSYYNNACAYCGIRNVTFTVEHIIPVSRQGTNDPYNLAPACLKCNCSKQAATLIEFLFLRHLRVRTAG